MEIPDFSTKSFDFRNYINCSEQETRTILYYRNLKDISKWMRNSSIISINQHNSFLEELKKDENRIYFAVFKANEYVASIYLTKIKGGFWERGIYVIPSFQKNGLATQIEIDFISKIKSLGIDTLIAEVQKNNLPSLRFHEKLGYKPIREDDNYIWFMLSNNTMIDQIRGGI